MTDRNNKDFFDDEYEKFERRNVGENGGQNSHEAESFENGRQNNIKDWHSSVVYSEGNDGGKKKPVHIALLCIALVLTLLLGFVLGVIINNAGRTNEEVLLSDVLKYVREYYYKDLSEKEWEEAIKESGTGFMQGAGDKYGRLLTPQEYYDLVNPVPDSPSENGSFGIQYQHLPPIGLYIHSVQPDSASYGVLQSGDIILSISSLKDKDGNFVKDENGNTVTSLDVKASDTNYVQYVIQATAEGDFTYLSGGEVKTAALRRGNMGNQNNRMSFVEYYFGTSDTNVSLTPQNGAKISTYEKRSLSKLPSDTGYIRLIEFSQFGNGDSVYSEFLIAMNKFKKSGRTKLILDLKNNPGGDVDLVSKIAGVLSTSAGMSEQQIASNKLLDKSGQLLITKLKYKSFPEYVKYVPSTYLEYFNGFSAVGKKNIVVWTDGGSASASELLTGVMLDYGTAFHIGNKTYGKGIAQSVIELDFVGNIITNTGAAGTEHWALYLTVASYFSPMGVNIHGSGYTPTAGYDGIDDYTALFDATAAYYARP